MRIKHHAYAASSTLRWFGTLVGDKNNGEVIVAAPTEYACLQAAQSMYPDSVIDLIQPVNVTRRTSKKPSPEDR